MQTRRYASACSVAALLVLIGIFYLRPGILLGTDALVGSDYGQLHILRIRFAREALFGIRHTLPAWYPHEALGTPFSANLQSFPWIPTRLLLLPARSVSRLRASGLYGRRAVGDLYLLILQTSGIDANGRGCRGRDFRLRRIFRVARDGRTSAASGGLSGASASVVAGGSRVRAGTRSPTQVRSGRFWHFCSTCVVRRGIRRVPAYSIAAALLYTAWKGKGWVQARVAGAITLGAGLALAAWWPMLMLIGRSTRILRLAAPVNDVVMPYSRLLALIVPGIQRMAATDEIGREESFHRIRQ